MPVLAPDSSARRGVQLLLRVSEKLNAGDGFESGLMGVLSAVVDTLPADAATLALPQHEGEGPYRLVHVDRGGKGAAMTVESPPPISRPVLYRGERLRQDEPGSRPGDGDADHDGPPSASSGSLIALPLHLRGKVLGAMWALRDSPHPFSDDDEDLLEAVADKLAVWVHNEGLIAALREQVNEREMLLQASRRVGESIDLEVVLSGLFDALQTTVHFDAAAIFLTQSDSTLAMSAQRGYANPEVIASVPEGQGIVGRARRQRRGVLIGDVREHPDYLAARPETRSEIAVPILSAGAAIGVVNLESDRPGEYDDRDLHLAELIAAQVASAIANARLHASRVRAAQMDSELGLAREIQLSLLPSGKPADARLQVAALNVPSSAVGGDYYDWLLVQPHHALLVIADVSGHGLSAALLTASMRTGFRMLARQTQDPAAIAGQLHALLYESSPPNQFVAGVIASLDLDRGVLRYCNAGHVPPFLLDAHGTLRELAGGGPPMGLLANASYQGAELQLTAGEVLAFYTDGIVEAENQSGEQLGLDRVRDVLVEAQGGTVDAIIKAMRVAVRAHRGRRGAHLDDVTMMAARWVGPTRT